jgi:hypothetical protein
MTTTTDTATITITAHRQVRWTPGFTYSLTINFAL